MSQFLDYLLETGTIVDGTMANSPSHQQQMWPLRERISEALLRDGYCYKYDISLPFKSFYKVINCKLCILGNSITYITVAGLHSSLRQFLIEFQVPEITLT